MFSRLTKFRDISQFPPIRNRNKKSKQEHKKRQSKTKAKNKLTGNFLTVLLLSRKKLKYKG